MVQRVWARQLMAAAVMGGVWPAAALAADVNVTSDTTTGVNLDSDVGSTAEIASGVNVSNGIAQDVVTAATSAWTVTNSGTITSDFAQDVVLSVGGSSVVNYGVIDGSSNNAIVLANGGSATNEAGATITTAMI